jgi:hypothetical protein
MEAGLAPVSRMIFSCVSMRKFHPACWDNFVVLTVVENSLHWNL